MMPNDELLDAYTEFNDAAVAMTTCQLAQATEPGSGWKWRASGSRCCLCWR